MEQRFGQMIQFITAVILVGLSTACQSPTPSPTVTSVPPTDTIRAPEAVVLASPVPRDTPLPPPATFTPLPPTARPKPPTPTATNPPQGDSAAFVMPGAVTATPPPPAEPADSLAVVAQFSADVLGVTAKVSAADSISVPPALQSVVDAASAATSVSALGAVGDGTVAVFLLDDSSVVAGDSLGVIVFHRTGIIPTDENAVLTLVQTEFPALAELPFAADSGGDNASLPAPGKALLPPPGGGTPQPQAGGWQFSATTTGKSVRVGVLPTGENQFDVFAVVGQGALAELANK